MWKWVVMVRSSGEPWSASGSYDQRLVDVGD